jgi:hypothetical protein
MADRIIIETEDFIYGNMEMRKLRVYQGRALQTPEMPPVPGEGEVRKGGVAILVLHHLQQPRQRLAIPSVAATQPSSS